MKQIFISIILGSLTSMLIGCSKNNISIEPEAKVSGYVKDASGNPYTNTLIRLSSGNSVLEDKTNLEGLYEFKEELEGTYELTIIPPLSTIVTSATTVTLNLEPDKVEKVDFTIEVKSIEADLVFGSADVFGEIRNKDGDIPTGPNEEIYARNVFDPPFGSLNLVKTPLDQPVTLENWITASGTVLTTCQGNKSIVKIELEGMIPSGTYTFWCNFLNIPRRVGQSVNFGTDVIRIEPLGSGTKNVVRADAEGKIMTTIEHPSCILTAETALVMIIDYHINGRTFGADHIPDAEDVNHLLVYFQ